MATTTELTHNTSSYGTMGYRPDHDDPTKMVPNVRQNEFFPHATLPAPETEVPRPTSVQVLNDRTGNIFFKFNDADGYINFGGTQQIATGEQPLAISPIAWSGSDGSSAAGDVIFVYKGEN